MDENSKIEELFREKLQGFESPVNDAMWSNISSNLTASTTGASSVAGKTIIGKAFSTIAIAVTTGIVATGITIMVMSDEEKSPVNNEKTEISKTDEISAPVEKEVDLTSDDNTEVNKSVPSVNPTDVEDPHLEVEKKEVYKVVPKETDKKYPKEPSAITSFMTSRADLERQKQVVPENNTENNESHEEIVYTDNTITVTKISESKVAASILASAVGGYAPLEVSFSNQSESGTLNWDFGDGTTSREENPTHIFDKEGSYIVELIVTDENGKTNKDQRVIEVQAKSSIANIPNIFTPNGDGKNDTFIIKGENIEHYKLVIIDRFGKEIFSSDSIEEGWDGKDLSENNVPKGSYFYVLSATGKDGKKYEYSGSIVLNR